MNPADFLAAKVYTGSQNIALIGKSQEFGMGDVYEPGSKTFTLLGSRSFPLDVYKRQVGGAGDGVA